MAVLGNYEKISGKMINKDKSSYYMYSKISNRLCQVVSAITGFAKGSEGYWDRPYWMPTPSGKFSVSSAWQILRHMADPNQEFKLMWIKGLPFKISFFLWRLWRKKISTDDMWRRQGKMVMSRCCCCYKALVVCSMLSKAKAIVSSNTRRHHLGILKEKKSIIQYFEGYKPILITTRVTWQLPFHGWYKCNTDGAAKGNTGPSSLGFGVRNYEGDAVYARAVDVGMTTNVVAEVKDILQVLEYCVEHDLYPLILEADSLVIEGE
uniref:Uncharacterized protein LOC104214886 n=1 Tax=Nicotiana sylvestris TaxID=4096 RepID=A0A1U7VDA1_NICSY|nr:PREDICTED: uncharacterized protein LOC104214886 [Nicotiana sylvestris]